MSQRGGRRQTFVPKDNVQAVEELPETGQTGVVYQRITDNSTFVWSSEDNTFQSLGKTDEEIEAIAEKIATKKSIIF